MERDLEMKNFNHHGRKIFLKNELKVKIFWQLNYSYIYNLGFKLIKTKRKENISVIQLFINSKPFFLELRTDWMKIPFLQGFIQALTDLRLPKVKT